MKYFNHTMASIVAATVLAVAGCGGGSGGSSYGDGGTGVIPSPPVTTPPPSPSPTGADFTAFMHDLFVPARTTDVDEPAELESIEWVFADDENEAKYDDIITASES